MGVKRYRPLKIRIFFFPKNRGLKVLLSYSKPDTAIVLVFILYDGTWTNNLSVVILRHNLAMHIF